MNDRPITVVYLIGAVSCWWHRAGFWVGVFIGALLSGMWWMQ
jgi:hypothetical protein